MSTKAIREKVIVAKHAIDGLVSEIRGLPYEREVRNMALRLDALAAMGFASEPSKTVAGLSKRTYPLPKAPRKR